jgi:hypothetical protein
VKLACGTNGRESIGIVGGPDEKIKSGRPSNRWISRNDISRYGLYLSGDQMLDWILVLDKILETAEQLLAPQEGVCSVEISLNKNQLLDAVMCQRPETS